QAAQAAFDVIRQAMQGTVQETKGCIVLATVQGDIHDIGKNIAKVLLENYCYEVVDLGRDVAPEAIVRATQSHHAGLVGLSALMTTTLPGMRSTIEALRAANLPCRVMVGGAVLTADYAQTIGADFYAHDAKSGVDIAREVFGK
ncbi:MAG: cobalamin-dependent protein, partial [Clostridia bacterium]